MMREFETKDGNMMIGGVSAPEIAREFGTPVYVVDEARIRENYRKVYEAYSKYMDTRIHYACKANTSLAVLRILEQEGSGIDAVSIGEVRTCLKAGFTPDRIMYTGVNVSNRELREVAETGVMINLDSVSEMERLAEISPGHSISFRITPNVGSGHSAKVITGSKGAKFGIPLDQVISTYAMSTDLGFDIKGIHAHIGSGGQSVDPFMDMVEVLINLTNEIAELGIELEFIDIGGGIGVPYKPQEEEMDVGEMAMNLTDMILEETDVKTIVLEPGRYIVCDAVVRLATVNDIKDTGVKTYIGTDAGFNTLIRPAMYDSYHHVAIANRMGKACTRKYDVVGPICESGDYLAHDRVLPDPQEGDILAVYNAGAYGFSMSSNYNSRPLCAEVLVNDGQAELIREAESIEEMWRHQIVPKRLQR